MNSATITIPDIRVELTIDQLITAVRQLEPNERARIARALAKTELDAELTQLISELYSQPPADEISDEAILAEIRAVREQRA